MVFKMIVFWWVLIGSSVLLGPDFSGPFLLGTIFGIVWLLWVIHYPPEVFKFRPSEFKRKYYTYEVVCISIPTNQIYRFITGKEFEHKYTIRRVDAHDLFKYISKSGEFLKSEPEVFWRSPKTPSNIISAAFSPELTSNVILSSRDLI